jgi:hypothetical protein
MRDARQRGRKGYRDLFTDSVLRERLGRRTFRGNSEIDQ